MRSGTLYRQFFDLALTRVDPELAHELGFTAVRAGGPLLRLGGGVLGRLLPDAATPPAPVEAMGLRFPHVLGLAAGFDKNAVGIDALARLGFGHVEVGTVTGRPQPGNPKPRLFRLPDDRAVINRMGFNNEGAEMVARRLRLRAARLASQHHPRTETETGTGTGTGTRPGPVLGINIGKTKVVPDDDQAAVLADYERSARLLAPLADYLVVNVSSPNTPGLRNLQAVEKLQPLLEHVRRTADEVTRERVPLLVKIAPDLSDDDVLAVADLALAIGLDGIIATNTTIAREGLRSSAAEVAAIGAGGLSGPPLAERALAVMRLLRGRAGADLTLVGVGGITTVDDARARLEAGATLLQAYTAFIYEGPLWPRTIVRGLAGR